MVAHRPHDEEGGEEAVPWSFREALSSAYYGLAIIVVLLGLVSFTVSTKWRVDGLEAREAEHPTRHELAVVATKVEDRIANIERRMEDLDIHGTRALADRTSLIEQNNHQQDERVQGLIARLNDLQASLNRANEQTILIAERQNSVIDAVRRLQGIILPGPVGPVGPGAQRPGDK